MARFWRDRDVQDVTKFASFWISQLALRNHIFGISLPDGELAGGAVGLGNELSSALTALDLATPLGLSTQFFAMVSSSTAAVFPQQKFAELQTARVSVESASCGAQFGSQSAGVIFRETVPSGRRR